MDIGKDLQRAYDDGYEQGKQDAVRWIPATERLPEDGVPVLACYIGYNSGLLRTDLLVCRHEDEWCYWHGETCSYNTCKVIITHWMPLPEPPKEET